MTRPRRRPWQRRRNAPLHRARLDGPYVPPLEDMAYEPEDFYLLTCSCGTRARLRASTPPFDAADSDECPALLAAWRAVTGRRR